MSCHFLFWLVKATTLMSVIPVILLASSDGSGGSLKACPALTDTAAKKLTEYVQKKYRIPAADLRLVEVSFVADSCYRKVRIESRPFRKLPVSTLYLSPDGRFLSSNLLDTHREPAAEEQARDQETAQRLSEDARNVAGPRDAQVAIVVFSDLQCPYCKRSAALLRDVLRTAEGKSARLIYRHFPLTRHAWARSAAEATECAGSQDRAAFWRMHDLVLDSQATLTGKDIGEQLMTLAGSIPELDPVAFQNCMDSGVAAGIVMRDVVLGVDIQVRGTPTIFVNGRRIAMPLGAEDLRAAIVEAMNRVTESEAPLLRPLTDNPATHGVVENHEELR